MTSHDFSAFGAGMPHGDCVYGQIYSHAKTSPYAVAIFGTESPSLTYGELVSQIDNTVRMLNETGIGRNDRVAVVLPNGPEMATAFLSISACATCAPLNSAYRSNEFEFFLKDLKAKALVLKKGDLSSARSVAQKLGVPVFDLAVSKGDTGIIFKPTEKMKVPSESRGYAQPDDTALVLHTSGTTSRPKIVPLSHKNLCASAGNIKKSLALTEKDICLNIMPLFHIHGLVGAVLSTLAAGGKVVCSPGFDEALFFSWITRFNPTWYTAVPTMHQAILSRYASESNSAATTSLRFIRSCSSPLPPRIFEDLESVFRVPVIESYGMTEAAHQMTSNPLPPGVRKIGSVGLAAGPEVGIMDEAGRILSVGDIGEIVIQGKNVTPGYENNPTANQAAFTNGWFRTGDQGYLDAEGYLFITGRIKEIINRAGEKIAPREVDEVLLEHPAVAQAVAFAVPHPTIGEDVAAAVVLKANASVTNKELREHAFHRMADFKVPSQIIFVDAIPKGATGKIQRIGLAEKLTSELKTEYVPPDDSISKTVSDIWRAVLDSGPVGIHDNFFYLGGDSLLAAQVITRIREAFSVDLPMSALFRSPTVEEQARAVEESLLDELEALPEEEAVHLDKDI